MFLALASEKLKRLLFLDSHLNKLLETIFKKISTHIN
jgi:hypothetical protein